MRGVMLACALVFESGAAMAAPPPPPPPDVYERMVRDGCGGSQTIVRPTQAPVSARPLTAQDLGLGKGRIGKLEFRGGVRLKGDALRVGMVEGLAITGKWGLVAVTESRQWLVLDLQGGRLGANGAGLAPMLGAPGPPIGLRDSVYGTMHVKFADGWSIYAVDVCGFAAKAVTDRQAPVDASDSWVRAAWRLRSVSDPDAHMPDARVGLVENYALWTPDSGAAEAIIEQRRLQPAAKPVELARLPLHVSAMVTMLNGSGIWALMTGGTGSPDELDVYLFSLER